LFNNLNSIRVIIYVVCSLLGRVPCAIASGSGYALQVLTGYACCGLFAAIPHADARVYTRTYV